MISIDTETTGIDVYHAARPFFVTTCNEQGEQRFWHWYVNPLTREPMIPEEDKEEIRSLIEDSDEELVGQNIKFDVAMLRRIIPELKWPWERTHDTLMAGHLLASNQPHDLTSMAMHYLGVDIEPLELRLQEVTQSARRVVQQARLKVKRSNTKVSKGKVARPIKEASDTYLERSLSGWGIAEEGLEGMPSAKEKTWKYDTWLPKQLAEWLRQVGWEKDTQGWEAALEQYANADSGVTILLFKEQQGEIRRRGLEKIYRQRMKLLPIAHGMEWEGVTLSGHRLKQLVYEYKEESQQAGKVCVSIAEGEGVNLTLPKSGTNGSLLEFMEHLLASHNVPESEITRTDTGRIGMDKESIPHYEAMMPPHSTGLLFLKSLRRKRKRDTGIQYMEGGYQRYWLPMDVNDPYAGWWVVHSSLNPTGSNTLRWSSSNPNSQNIAKGDMLCPKCDGEGKGCTACNGKGTEAKSLRFCFGPPPGWEWFSLDAKNIELRLPFYKSKQQELIDLFEHPDDPPYYGSTHLLNFSVVYPDIWETELKEVGLEKVGPHCKKKYAASYYQWCKNGGFAKQYGGQKRKVDATFRREGAFDLIDSRFSRLAALNAEQIDKARRLGYVETMPDKTVDPDRGYPILCTRTEYGEILPTVPLSYYIQGTAMQWTAKAMVRTNDQLTEWRLKERLQARIIMQVHDELVFAFSKRGDPVAEHEGKAPRGSSNLLKVRKIQSLMEKGGEDIGIPTPVGVEYHPENWSEGITL